MSVCHYSYVRNSYLVLMEFCTDVGGPKSKNDLMLHCILNVNDKCHVCHMGTSKLSFLEDVKLLFSNNSHKFNSIPFHLYFGFQETTIKP